MIDTVFKFDEKKCIVLNEDILLLCEHLDKVDPVQLSYIIFVYDYVHSPMRLKPIGERRLQSARKFYPEFKDPEAEGLIPKEAIEEYQSFVYDSRYYALDALKGKIVTLNNFLIDADEPKKMKEISESIKICTTRIDQIRDEIFQEEVSEFNVVLKGGRSMSLIEIVKSNKDEWKKMQHVKSEN